MVSELQKRELFNDGGKWKDTGFIVSHEKTTQHTKAFLAFKEAGKRLF